MSVAFIDANRHRWPVSVMCEVLELSERTYYAAKKRPLSARALSDETAKVEIRRVWEANYRAYGAKRVWLTLRREGRSVIVPATTLVDTRPPRPRVKEINPGPIVGPVPGVWR